MQKRIVGLRTPPMPQGLLVLPRMSPACSVVVVVAVAVAVAVAAAAVAVAVAVVVLVLVLVLDMFLCCVVSLFVSHSDD